MPYRNEEEKVLESGTKTSSGTGSTITGIDHYKEAVFHLIVTAASGTDPTLDVTIQECIGDESVATNWVDAVSFTQKTAAGSERKVLTQFGRSLRVKYTIDGTNPSFTFKVVGSFKD